jgi:hypothetical protein
MGEILSGYSKKARSCHAAGGEHNLPATVVMLPALASRSNEEASVKPLNVLHALVIVEVQVKVLDKRPQVGEVLFAAHGLLGDVVDGDTGQSDVFRRAIKMGVWWPTGYRIAYLTRFKKDSLNTSPRQRDGRFNANRASPDNDSIKLWDSLQFSVHCPLSSDGLVLVLQSQSYQGA